MRLDTVRLRYGYGTGAVRQRLLARIGRITVRFKSAIIILLFLKSLLSEKYESDQSLLPTKIRASHLSQLKENLNLNLEQVHKYRIEGLNAEFEYSFAQVNRNIFECNYNLDENCLPSHFILLRRETVLSNLNEILKNLREFLKQNSFKNKAEVSKIENDFLIKEIESQLRGMLRDSAHLLYLNGDMNKSDRDMFFEIKSECESQLNIGILELSQREASERTLSFFRNFTIPSQSSTSDRDFDLAESSLLLTQLKKRIEQHLPPNNIIPFNGIKVNQDGDIDVKSHLENFGKYFQEKIISLFTKSNTYNKNKQISIMYDKEPHWRRAVYQDQIENYFLRKRLGEKFVSRGEDDIAVEKVGFLGHMIFYLESFSEL
jgi:hypothetical protein